MDLGGQLQDTKVLALQVLGIQNVEEDTSDQAWRAVTSHKRGVSGKDGSLRSPSSSLWVWSWAHLNALQLTILYCSRRSPRTTDVLPVRTYLLMGLVGG